MTTHPEKLMNTRPGTPTSRATDRGTGLVAEHDAGGWRQVTVWCADWQAAERAGVEHLGPALAAAEDAKDLTSWWFLRKGGSWRIRFLPAPGHHEHTAALITDALTGLTHRGDVQRWASLIYEPEVHAFGGTAGIEIAHNLFHLDSRHLLRHLHHPASSRRREIGLMLASQLLRSAGLDWYEQGDVWARLAAHRLTAPPETGDLPIAAVHQLLTARTHHPHSPLATAPRWPAAFDHAGRRLADLARHGELTRGLRGVLTHHLLFAWNRAGIPGDQQALLAATAAHASFHQPPHRTDELIRHLSAPDPE